jgi:YfiH family protein
VSPTGSPQIPREVEPRFSSRHGRTWLTYPELDSPRLIHGIVVFRELVVGTAHGTWIASARAYFRQVPWASAFDLVVPLQVHGTRILTLRANEGRPPRSACAEPECAEPECAEADGVVTDCEGLLVGVSVADCLPLVAFDLADGVIAVAHCGWRGIAAGIVEELGLAIDRLAGEGAARARTRYLVGASVGACCYEVRDDLLGRFTPDEVRRFTATRDHKTFFDLKQVVASRLEARAVRPGDILIDKTCTACNKSQLSSYRREGASCGRMLAVLAISPTASGGRQHRPASAR